MQTARPSVPVGRPSARSAPPSRRPRTRRAPRRPCPAPPSRAAGDTGLGGHEVDLVPPPAVGTAPRVRDLRPRRACREPPPLLAGHDVVHVVAPGAPPDERFVGDG